MRSSANRPPGGTTREARRSAKTAPLVHRVLVSFNVSLLAFRKPEVVITFETDANGGVIALTIGSGDTRQRLTRVKPPPG